MKDMKFLKPNKFDLVALPFTVLAGILCRVALRVGADWTRETLERTVLDDNPED
jgi:hypothetical protein